MQSELIAEVTRSGEVESRHYGSVAVVDAGGRLLASLGDPDRLTYMRSAAKPLQAIPAVERGAVDSFGITARELAVICASHQGQDFHVEAVRSVLQKIGLSEDSLQCGIHDPVNTEAAAALRRSGAKPSPVHNNCSGKHSGMLALCRHIGADEKSYLQPDHPVQQAIFSTLVEMLGLDPAAIHVGVDGCGAPTFAVRLSSIALGYAKFAEAADAGGVKAGTLQRIAAAMVDNPEMISGTGGLDTDLMDVCRDKCMVKGGAEGLKAIALLGRGIGVAVRIEDGGSRPFSAVLVRLLSDLGVLDELQPRALAERQPDRILNHQGKVVGEVRAAFSLGLRRW